MSNISSSSSKIIKSVTSGVPLVIVPVLSKTTVFIWCAFSKISAFLINKPFSAPFPVPHIMATGVAKPKAHGQAITTTVIAKLNDSSKLLLNIIFRMKVRREIPRIKGTNIALTLSASKDI